MYTGFCYLYFLIVTDEEIQGCGNSSFTLIQLTLAKVTIALNYYINFSAGAWKHCMHVVIYLSGIMANKII